MRLPSRALEEFPLDEICARKCVVLACLNFEERCTALPLRMVSRSSQSFSLYLFELIDAPGGIPDYHQERNEKTKLNRDALDAAGVKWVPLKRETLSSEDALISVVNELTQSTPETVVIDITAIPKRIFCFVLRRIMSLSTISNVVVTYTEAGAGGYTTQHLAADVMSPETLPGFAGRFSDAENNLVASIGFEALGLRALILSLYREDNANLRILLPFPAPLETVRRQWNTVREIMEGESANIRKDSVAVVAAWDAEQVYHRLAAWAGSGKRLSLAPYGPKPHTLGMVLFAIQFDSSIWYTQPKVYHPDYSIGTGPSRWYVVKWGGVKCFDRE